MTLTTTLSEELNAIVEAHAERSGSTPTSALDDLIRRGAAQVDWREIREGIEDIRSTAIDTFAALDAIGPYSLATLQLLAHWAARSEASKFDELAYSQEALAVAGASWDATLTASGIPLPPRAQEA